MNNSNNIIELRNRMINALIEQGKREYGVGSATFKSENFRVNIGIQVSRVLKPVMLANR